MRSIPLVWDLIKQFKCQCKLMGWWASPYEDVIYAGGEYHNFFCTRRVYPKTFKIISLSHVYPVRENDIFYRLVNVSYTAWIFQERPTEDMFMMVTSDHDMRRHIAIYDLSGAYSERPTCIKMNETKSIVFQEFEKFLKNEYNIDLINKIPLPKRAPQNREVIFI